MRAAAVKVCSKASSIWRSVSRMTDRSSRSAVSRSVRWLSSSSTCARASPYSSCASGLTGPSCSRRRVRRSTRERSPAISSSPRGSASASSPSPPAPSRRDISVELELGLGGLVAQPLGRDLRLGDPLSAGAQRGLDLRLLLGAVAQLAGHPLPRLAVCGELLLELRRPGLHGLGGPCRAPRPGAWPAGPPGCRPLSAPAAGQRGRRSARARARSSPPGGARPRARPASSARRTASGPSAGAERRCSISQPVRRSSSSASAWLRSACPQRRLGAGAREFGRADLLEGALDLAAGAVLVLCGALGGGDQAVAFVAAGEHALGAPLADLAHLAPGREQHAAAARDRDAAEVGRQALEPIDDPRVGEQPATRAPSRPAGRSEGPAGARLPAGPRAGGAGPP